MEVTFLNESLIIKKLDLSAVSDVENFCHDFVEENFPEFQRISLKGFIDSVYSMRGCRQPVKIVRGKDWIVFGGLEKISGSSNFFQNIILVAAVYPRIMGALIWDILAQTSLDITHGTPENLKKLSVQLDIGMKLLSSASTQNQAEAIFKKMRDGKTAWKAAV